MNSRLADLQTVAWSCLMKTSTQSHSGSCGVNINCYSTFMLSMSVYCFLAPLLVGVSSPEGCNRWVLSYKLCRFNSGVKVVLVLSRQLTICWPASSFFSFRERQVRISQKPQCESMAATTLQLCITSADEKVNMVLSMEPNEQVQSWMINCLGRIYL